MRRFVLGLALSAMTGLSPNWVLAADPETAQRIAQSLRASGQLVDYSIGVQFEDGTAWLSGRVASAEQEQAAIDLARQLPYVDQVVSDLEVRATKPAAEATPVRVRPTFKDTTLSFLGVKRADAVQDVDAYNQANISPVAAEQAMPQDPGDPLVQTPKGQFAPVASRRFAEAPVVRGTGPKPTTVSTTPVNIPVAYNQAPQRVAAIPAVQTRSNVPQATRSMVPAQQVGLRGRRQPAPCPPGGGGYPAAQGYGAGGGYGGGPVMQDQANLPNYAWPSYAAHPNYAAVTYPTQYSATAWPYIGPFYPYPQVPLGWRKVTLEWDDGWWWLDFKDRHHHH